MSIVGTIYIKDDLNDVHEVTRLISAEMIHILYGDVTKFRVRLETTMESRERIFFMDLDTALFVELEAWIKDNTFNSSGEVLKVTVYKDGDVKLPPK